MSDTSSGLRGRLSVPPSSPDRMGAEITVAAATEQWVTRCTYQGGDRISHCCESQLQYKKKSIPYWYYFIFPLSSKFKQKTAHIFKDTFRPQPCGSNWSSKETDGALLKHCVMSTDCPAQLKPAALSFCSHFKKRTRKMTGSFSQPQARCQEPKISLPQAEMISSPPRSWSSESRALQNSLVSSLIS